MKIIIRRFDDKLHYPIKSDSYANIKYALDIWMKFSSYLKAEEQLFMDKTKDKELSSLSQIELDEYHRIKEQLKFSKLLLKYKNKICTKEEHDFVSKYMDTSLRCFVKSKISKEQQESAKKIISDLLEKKELEQYIELQQEQYDSLNIYEAYILFIAKEKLYDIIRKETDDKIRREQVERVVSLRKSLIRDYGHKF